MEVNLVEKYIAEFSGEVLDKLNKLKSLIERCVPDVSWKMSYGMPTAYYHGNLVHFAVNKNHIGFYPAPSGVDYFLTFSDLYPTSKGAIKFDLNKEIPYEIIEKVVLFRKEENLNKSRMKKK